LSRIKAVLFIEMTNTQVLGLRFMDRMKCRGLYGVEVVDFKCFGRRYKYKENKKRGYSYIKLPGPIAKGAGGIKMALYEDYSWLNSFIVGTHSRAGDLSTWKIKCATNFLRCLERMGQIAESHGRSVWFVARPLEQKNWFRGLDCSIACSHWGILVSQLSRCQMMERMDSNSSNRSQMWGDLHELRNLHGQATYGCKRFSAADYRRGTVSKYLGQTDMTDEELENYGKNQFSSCR
jgi:hypothetical protein